MKWQTAAAITISGAVWLATRQARAATVDSSDDYTNASDYPTEPDQLPDTWETFTVTIDPTNYLPAFVDDTTAARNERAFLDMISYAEGTNGPQGYAAMFGYPRADRIAQSLADHPRQFFSFTNSRGETLRTSAAGRYQFLIRTWDALQKQLDLPDFGPQSQDSAALELIRQRGALNDVRAGRTEAAIVKCAPIWASLPGAGYAQPERKLSTLIYQYAAAGGSFA